jgi:hypothetical protein
MYAAEMSSVAIIYLRSFIQTGSGSKVNDEGEGDSQTHREHGYLISLLLFLQHKESRLIIGINFYYHILI